MNFDLFTLHDSRIKSYLLEFWEIENNKKEKLEIFMNHDPCSLLRYGHFALHAMTTEI